MTAEQIDELCDFLEGSDGCDFREDHTWLCDGTLVKTLQWLSEHGLSEDAVDWHACCDCEVVFNAPRR